MQLVSFFEVCETSHVLISKFYMSIGINMGEIVRDRTVDEHTVMNDVAYPTKDYELFAEFTNFRFTGTLTCRKYVTFCISHCYVLRFKSGYLT